MDTQFEAVPPQSGQEGKAPTRSTLRVRGCMKDIIDIVEQKRFGDAREAAIPGKVTIRDPSYEGPVHGWLASAVSLDLFESDDVQQHPKLMELIELFKKSPPELVAAVAPTEQGYVGYRGRRLLSILNNYEL